jgi:hypothetical protein
MNTTSFPANSLGARLQGGPDRPLPPIPIPSEIAERSAIHAAREEQRRHKMKVVAGCVAGMGALAALAVVISR